MIVTLAREAHRTELGTFQELLFAGDELRTTDETVLAIHQHNRWRRAQEGVGGETFIRLDIVGPLVVRTGDGAARTLGPYEHFSCVDGVSYVERRVFGFWDLQQRDWYFVDLGVHSKVLRLSRAGV